MDEIATEIGVSKTVLYRYFSDKGDLTRAAMSRFVDTVLAPRIFAAIASAEQAPPGTDGEYVLARAAVAAYVGTVATDPEVYRYVMGNGTGPDESALADAERLFADVVRGVLTERAGRLNLDTSGATAWSYAIVGAVHLATHWWVTNKTMSADELIDYLTMMTWSAVEGIARAGGSITRFNEMPHTLAVPAAQ
jgi:AcrR family transcriptional regulator